MKISTLMLASAKLPLDLRLHLNRIPNMEGDCVYSRALCTVEIKLRRNHQRTRELLLRNWNQTWSNWHGFTWFQKWEKKQKPGWAKGRSEINNWWEEHTHGPYLEFNCTLSPIGIFILCWYVPLSTLKIPRSFCENSLGRTVRVLEQSNERSDLQRADVAAQWDTKQPTMISPWWSCQRFANVRCMCCICGFTHSIHSVFSCIFSDFKNYRH